MFALPFCCCLLVVVSPRTLFECRLSPRVRLKESTRKPQQTWNGNEHWRLDATALVDHHDDGEGDAGCAGALRHRNSGGSRTIREVSCERPLALVVSLVPLCACGLRTADSHTLPGRPEAHPVSQNGPHRRPCSNAFDWFFSDWSKAGEAATVSLLGLRRTTEVSLLLRCRAQRQPRVETKSK